MRKYDYFLLVLALTLIAGELVGTLAAVLMFTIIGIPLAFGLIVAPAFAFVLIPARILDRLALGRLFPNRLVTGFAAIVIVLAASALYALFDNARQDAVIAQLRAGDVDNLPRPLADQSIALAMDSNDLGCSSLCQRLLLTGQATSVLVAPYPSVLRDGKPDFAAKARKWQLESLGPCAPLPAKLDESHLVIPGEPPWPGNPEPHKLILQGIAAGRCLTVQDAVLGAADLILLDAPAMRRGAESDFTYAPGIQMLSADRREIWMMRHGAHRMVARWTHVSASRLPDIAVPLVLDERWEFGIGLWRKRFNSPASQPAIAGFVQDQLGLRLSLTEAAVLADQAGAQNLQQALGKAGPLAPDMIALAHSTFGRGFGADQATPAMRALLLQVLADRRIPPANAYLWAFHHLNRPDQMDFARQIAEIGFDRLGNDRTGHPVDRARPKAGQQVALPYALHAARQEIDVLTRLLAILPAEALQPHAPKLLALAADRQSRGRIPELLPRLADLGEPGARALVGALGDTRDLDAGYHMPGATHRAALLGLCRLGAASHVVLPEYLHLIETGAVHLNDNRGQEVAILLLMGHPPELVRCMAQQGPRPLPDKAFEQIQKQPAKRCD